MGEVRNNHTVHSFTTYWMEIDLWIDEQQCKLGHAWRSCGAEVRRCRGAVEPALATDWAGSGASTSGIGTSQHMTCGGDLTFTYYFEK